MKKKAYCTGKRYHNGKFIGWALWLTHLNCTKDCCPVTVAEFYGKGAKSLADKVQILLEERSLGEK